MISYDAYDLDGIKRLEDKGVTDCIVGFRVPYIKGPDTEPLETKIEHLERYAEHDHREGRVCELTGRDGALPGGDRRGREADRERAVHPHRAGPGSRATTTSPAGSGSSLQMAFDYDLDRPVLINPTHQFARQGLDNPDAIYFNAYLDARASSTSCAGAAAPPPTCPSR